MWSHFQSCRYQSRKVQSGRAQSGKVQCCRVQAHRVQLKHVPLTTAFGFRQATSLCVAWAGGDALDPSQLGMAASGGI